jgi:hypothetical protein
MMLTILTFLPLAAGLLVALLGPDRQKLGAISPSRPVCWRWRWRSALGGFRQFAQRNAICRTRAVGAVFGDRILSGRRWSGVLMVLLSALIVPFAMLASWKIENNPKLYFSLVLFLESGCSARSRRRISSIGFFSGN